MKDVYVMLEINQIDEGLVMSNIIGIYAKKTDAENALKMLTEEYGGNSNYKVEKHKLIY